MIDMHHGNGHFQKRIPQRGLSSDDVDFVLAYGVEIHRAGAVHFLLRGKDIPDNFQRQYARLIGTTILVAERWDTQITAYRAQRKQAMKNVCRKAKQDLRRFFQFIDDDEEIILYDGVLAA